MNYRSKERREKFSAIDSSLSIARQYELLSVARKHALLSAKERERS
ncbi:MAG: hypothetical protein AAGC64_08240 [Bacteroidota bacterium]